MKRTTKADWAIAIVVSILIGAISSLLFGGKLNKPLISHLWNAGYSISIGLPLFANGYLFEWFAQKHIDWINRPVKSIFLALTAHLAYSTLVIFTVNWFWFIVVSNYSWEDFWRFNRWTIFSEYIIFIIIASIIYATSFFRAWRNQVQETEHVKREALALRYQVLQDQINPHFLFNSLNILGSLMDVDVLKAKTFVRELSLFYRDVLQFKDLDLISLQEEIAFVEKYIYLQQIRFGAALQVKIKGNPGVERSVIPLSLQTLVENAVKHNEISKANPLKIAIAVSDDDSLIVENNLQPKITPEPGSKTGLENLAGRYEFLTGRKVQIIRDAHCFRVVLPLIKFMEK